MKLFKIKIVFTPFYIYPFRFLTDWKYEALLYYEYLKVKHKFNKLNWNDDDVWNLTSFCCCLDDAIQRLCYTLTDDKRLHPKLKILIEDGYEREWKRTNSEDLIIPNEMLF